MNNRANRAVRLLAAIAAIPLLVSVLADGAAAKPADYTFNLVIEAHCKSNTTVCDYGTEDDFRNWALQGVYNMNNHWRPVGISFKLKSVTFAYGDDYANVTTPGGEAGQEADLVLINNLRAKAAANPGDVYLFVLDSLPMCFSGVPGAHLGRTPSSFAPDEYYGVFCDGVDGNTIAHEFGHHFCLAHPFSFDEPSAMGTMPNHDGDGISDTPPDPGVVEGVDTNAAADKRADADAVFNVGNWCGDDPESCANVINDYRDWCGYDQFPTAPGSAMANYCTPDCRRKTPDGYSSPGYSPLMNLTMSYYFRECGGPFVYNFTTYEGFTPGEIAQMRECHEQGSERGQLVNTCAGDGDTDWDGLCNKQDPCPEHRASIWDPDVDSDDVPDTCDSCPGIANSGIDTDGDGVDNACDPNDDNDACNDLVDEHPLDATIQIGQLMMPGCDDTSAPIMASDSADTDGDKIPDCRDPDNDNDGVNDTTDPCPNLANSEMCNIPGEGCALQIPWASCIGGGCQMDLMARLESIMHPDDPRLDFPAILRGDSIFLLPAVGHTAGELRGAMTGRNFGMVEGGEKIKMTLVDKTTGAVVADVGTFRIADAAVVGGTLGNSLEVAFKGVSSPVAATRQSRAVETLIKLQVGLTWGVGIPAGDSQPDGDSDGVPDSADNCVTHANPSQSDIDGDRIGDICDPDFDNDGIVGQAESDMVTNCVGVNVRSGFQFREPGQFIPAGENAALAHAASMRCRIADLDGDGTVTASDQEIAVEFIGAAPGPTGLVPVGEPVEPLPDPSPELVSDIVAGDIVAPVDTNVGQDTVIGIDTGTGGNGGGDGCSAGNGGASRDGSSGLGGTSGTMLPLMLVGLFFLTTMFATRRRRG